VRLIAIIVIVLTCVGCGQKGKLYLPQQTSAAKQKPPAKTSAEEEIESKESQP